MNDPSVQGEFFLEDNDIIHVGIAERVVSISGAVRRQFRYELEPEENMKSLVQFAGGFIPQAYLKNIQVTRFEGDEEKILDVNWREILDRGTDFELRPGDRVFVRSIPKPFQNFVSISGAVEIDGKFQLKTGMRISDLVKQAELKKDARRDLAVLLRTTDDGLIKYQFFSLEESLNADSAADLILEPEDRVQILSQLNYTDNYSFSVNGAVRSPGQYSFDSGQKVRLLESIELSGGLVEGAADFAYVKRISMDNPGEIKYIRINVAEALADPNSDQNLVIQPKDEISFFSKEKFSESYQVVVGGAVRDPRAIPYSGNEGLRVSDLIDLAGGIKT